MMTPEIIAAIVSAVVSVIGVIVAGAMLYIKSSELKATTDAELKEIKATTEADAQTKINDAYTRLEDERRELTIQLNAAKDEANGFSLQLVDALHKVDIHAEKQQTNERLIAGLESQIRTLTGTNASLQKQIDALTHVTETLQGNLKSTMDELAAVNQRAERAEARAERAESELATERQRADDEEGKRKHLEGRVAELEAKAARVPELEEQVKRLQGTIDAMRLEKENAHVSPSAVSDPVGTAAPVAADGVGAGSDAGSRDEQPVANPERAGVVEPTAGG